MKKILKGFLMLFACIITFILLDCSALAAVKINKMEKTIYVGDTYKLKVSGTKKSVKWTSSKKSIATVDKNGKVTAKKAGTTTITGKIGSKKYKCTITVKKPSLNEAKLTLTKGSKSTLKLLGTKAVSWKSSKSSVVSVDKKGKIKAKKVGSATVSVKAKNGKTYKCKVIVTEVENTEDDTDSTDTEPTTPTKPIVPVVHTHNYIVFSTKDATCEEDGYKIYRCAECGDTYTETIEKLGHNYVVDQIIAPNCTEQGYAVYKCTWDGSTYKDNYTDALGHNYILSETKEPTCTEEGYRLYKCSRCGDSYRETIKKRGHNYVSEVIAPTCEEQGYTLYTCTRCGDSYKDNYTKALGHDWNTGVVAVEATDTSLGYKIYTCKRCGEKVKMPYALPQQIDIGNGQTKTVYGYWNVEMADEIFTMLNEYRVQNGLNALETYEVLDDYAKTRALELTYLYSHTRPNMSGITFVPGGENVSATKESALAYINSWKSSTNHNANMLKASYYYGAVGVFDVLEYRNSDNTVKSSEFSNETQEYGGPRYAVQNFDYY